MRKEIFAESQDQLVRHGSKIERGSRGGRFGQPRRDRIRNAVLGQVAEVGSEAFDLARDALTQREDLLELVEDQDRRQEIVLGAPEFESRAMEVLPQCLARVEPGSLDVLLLDRLAERLL